MSDKALIGFLTGAVIFCVCAAVSAVVVFFVTGMWINLVFAGVDLFLVRFNWRIRKSAIARRDAEQRMWGRAR